MSEPPDPDAYLALMRVYDGEFERLTRERDEWKEWHANMQALRDKHSASVDRLMAERDRLRAALDWYARNLGASKSKDMRIIVQDGGARAREALGEPKP